MDVKYRPLFITPFIYNEWNINSIINTALVDSLPESFQPVILCTKHSNCRDRERLLMTNGNIFDRALLRLAPKSFIQRLEQSPDIYNHFWIKSAIKAASMSIKKGKVNYIHSISIPYTSHLVALELKRKFNIPWVAQFYEPWGDNPYRTLSKRIVCKNEKWERKCVSASDMIIHNNDIICNHWLEKYGDEVRGKLLSLPMSFVFASPASLAQKSIIDDGKLRITHIGNLYGLRKAEAFIKALAELMQERPLLRDKIEVSFIGKMNSEDISLVEKLMLHDVVKIVGVLSERECEYYYSHSDIFLLIEAESQGTFFFPSKLIRYYYYNRPIFALTNIGSVTYAELKKNGHYSCIPSSISGIKEYLLKAITDYNSLLGFNKDVWERFDARNVSIEYSRIVDKIVK